MLQDAHQNRLLMPKHSAFSSHYAMQSKLSSHLVWRTRARRRAQDRHDMQYWLTMLIHRCSELRSSLQGESGMLRATRLGWASLSNMQYNYMYSILWYQIDAELMQCSKSDFLAFFLSTNTKSLAKEFSKILIFECFGDLKTGVDVFFDADSESPRMT